jgi:hypothetical protein
MVNRTVAPLVSALEQHRAVTASLLDRLDWFIESGGSAVEQLVSPFTDLLREEDRALEPLVEQLAHH